MRDVMQSALWTLIVAGVVSYASFLFFGSIFASAADDSVRTVVVRDTLMKDGSHRISGMIMVSSSCEHITLTPRKIEEGEYLLSFSTRREPHVDCKEEMTPRAFRTNLFTPEKTQYLVTLNSTPLPVSVIVARAQD